MCRWLAYSGSPLSMHDLLYKPKHSLIDQSLHARLGPHTTNGDGFGIGWYGRGDAPALYKCVDPVWSDRNLRELSAEIQSGLMFAHIRAATGTPVQQTNCHPFRYGKWLWMHNGQINRFIELKRELVLAIDPDLYPHVEGSSDTEFFFFLALTFGLEHDPPAAVARAVGLIESLAAGRGIEQAMRMSVAVSDGRTVWAFRYSTEGTPPSLYYSTKVDTLRAQYPGIEILQTLSDECRLIVSEPLGDLAGVWNEIPPSTYGAIQEGQDEIGLFRPVAG
jgi:glutamine amidotransferase